jgi:hypothetical protein
MPAALVERRASASDVGTPPSATRRGARWSSAKDRLHGAAKAVLVEEADRLPAELDMLVVDVTISTIGLGSTAPAIFIATRCTWSSASS